MEDAALTRIMSLPKMEGRSQIGAKGGARVTPRKGNTRDVMATEEIVGSVEEEIYAAKDSDSAIVDVAHSPGLHCMVHWSA